MGPQNTGKWPPQSGGHLHLCPARRLRHEIDRGAVPFGDRRTVDSSSGKGGYARGPLVKAVSVFVVLSAAVFAAPAQAGERARLRFSREATAAECPDERALRDAVSARLGYEPFVADAPRLVVVTFRREGSTLRGVVQLREADGSVRGERTLTSTRGDCDELAQTTTLTISILLDPRSGFMPPRPPEREPVPDFTPPPKAPPEDSARGPAEAKAPPTDAFRLRVGLGAAASIGAAPAAAFGALVGVGVEHAWWSLMGELRADLPASGAPQATGGTSLTVRTRYTAGNLVPCGHFGVGYACASLTLGAIQGEVLGAVPSRQSTFQAMIGPRLGLALPLARWLSADAHVDGAYALTDTTFRVLTAELWTTPAISGLVSIGMVGRFP